MADTSAPDSNPLTSANPTAVTLGFGGDPSRGIGPTSMASQAPGDTSPSFAPAGNTIGSSNLKPTLQVQIAPPVQSPDLTGSILGGAQQTATNVQDYINKLTPTQQTSAQQQQQSILDSIANLTGQDSGKQQALADAQQQSGAVQAQADLTSLNNQLLTKTAAYNQQFNSLGGTGGTVESNAVLAAQQGGLQRAHAADIGLLTAQIQAKQGDLKLAQDTAQRAVDAKYSVVEDQIKTKQAQLAALAPALSADEKTQALAQQQVLKDQENAVADQKANEQKVNEIALQAAQYGATPQAIAAIQGSKNVVDAINAVQPYLGAKFANDLKQQAFDNAIKLRTAANDATRLAIEQETAQMKLTELQGASKLAAQNVVTTPSGKTYVDGSKLDSAATAAAVANGQLVLNGKPLEAVQAVNNVQQQFGTLLTQLQQSGVDLTKTTNIDGQITNQGGTGGFMNYWAAGNATPALRNFATALSGTNKAGTDGIIGDLQKLPNTGELVATLKNNVPKDTDAPDVLQTKLGNIKSALVSAENTILVDNSKPTQLVLNGKTYSLQADGTYQ